MRTQGPRVPLLTVWIGLAACADGALMDYCERTGKCACPDGDCCIAAGSECDLEKGQCCGGLFCDPKSSRCAFGRPADLIFEPEQLTLPWLQVGSRSEPVPFQLRNVGTVSTSVLGIHVAADPSVKVDPGSCDGAVLKPAQSCMGSVVFAPDRVMATTFSIEARESSFTQGSRQVAQLPGSAGAGYVLSLETIDAHVTVDGALCNGSCEHIAPAPKTLILEVTSVNVGTHPNLEATGLPCTSFPCALTLDRAYIARLAYRPNLKVRFTAGVGYRSIVVQSDLGSTSCNVPDVWCWVPARGATSISSYPGPFRWGGACSGTPVGERLCRLEIQGPTEVTVQY